MEICNISDIKDENIQRLLSISEKARDKAYQRYSNFSVGAALETISGEVITGCNVENVSFGLTICAERTAVVKAVSEGHRDYKAIAICAVSKSDFLVSPCGACRQVLSEFNANLPIYLYDCERKRIGITSLPYLLPQAVLPKNMKNAIL